VDKRTKDTYLAKKENLKLTQSIPETLEARELLRIRTQKEDHYDLVKRNSKLRALKGISKEENFYEILDLYLKGATIKELSNQFHYDEDKVRSMIDDHHEQLANSRAAHSLIITSKEGYNPVLEKLKAIEVINDEFLSKLSPEDSPTLSEEEALFCWIYVHKGDSQEAIEMATLDTGLFKEQIVTYKRGIFSRSLYLQNKNNVAQYITQLREQRYYTEDISKQYIQQLLLEQIDQVKSKGDRKDAVHLRQLIELLGKTIGAFTEKIEVMEYNPSRSLDLLIEMAQEASVKELH
jgi:hypothetical protein